MSKCQRVKLFKVKVKIGKFIRYKKLGRVILTLTLIFNRYRVAGRFNRDKHF
jgi:hypothetical protein